MIVSSILLVTTLAYSATYKCKDAKGNWSEAACAQPKPEPQKAPAVRDPNMRAVVENIIGCRNKDELQKFAQYRNDPEALRKYTYAAIASGHCTQFKANEIVYKVDSSLLDELVKVRRVGDLGEFWTVSQAVIQ